MRDVTHGDAEPPLERADLVPRSRPPRVGFDGGSSNRTRAARHERAGVARPLLPARARGRSGELAGPTPAGVRAARPPAALSADARAMEGVLSTDMCGNSA
jgi:hypothetical protein